MNYRVQTIVSIDDQLNFEVGWIILEILLEDQQPKSLTQQVHADKKRRAAQPLQSR